MRNKIVILLVLFFIFSITGFASGGGFFSGYQTTELPFINMNFEKGQNLFYFGGHGYGVSRSGYIYGGFGLAIMNDFQEHEDQVSIGGGFGGFIYGYRFARRPVNIKVTSWTGIGGIGIFEGDIMDPGWDPLDEEGYFSLFQEFNLEVGIPIGIFLLSGYIGYQFIGNILPGRVFDDFFVHSPVLGFRVTFGWH